MTTTTVPTVSHPQGDATRWAVETHGLTKRFGDNVAVNGVELLVPRGCAFGYLGPNGAGKTTLIRVLLGLTHADAGTMFVLGHPVPKHREPGARPRRRHRRRTAVPRPSHRPTEPADPRRRPRTRRRDTHRTGPRAGRHLAPRRRQGRRSTRWACASASVWPPACSGIPQLLILDEPMNGLDPAGMQDMRDDDPLARGRGPHRGVVVAPARRDRAHLRRGRHRGPRERVVRQGPISELLAGTSLVVPGRVLRARARPSPCWPPIRSDRDHDRAEGADDHAATGTGDPVIAEINRMLVDGGISVYRLQEVQASLESWFLQVTSRLGDPDDGRSRTAFGADSGEMSGDHRGSWIPRG